MLSNKWTFSLKILVVMLAVAFVGHTAMAAEFAVTMSVGAGVDVGSADNIQVEHSVDNGGATGATGIVTINVKFDQVVNADSATTGATVAATNGTQFRWDDLQIIAYNEFGGIETSPGIDPGPTAATTADGKNFTIVLDAPGADVTRVLVFLAKHKVELADPRAELDDDGKRKPEGKNAEQSITIYYVAGEPEAGDPTVYSIRRASDPLLPVTAATENVIILLSEQPKAFTKDNVDAANATWGDPVALVAIPEVTGDTDAMLSTGRDNKLYPYVLTITPKYENKNDIVVKVKAFEDMVLPTSNKYTPDTREADYDEGMDKLTIKVGKEAPKAGTAGLPVVLAKELFIPTDGYLVVADDEAGSAIINPGGAKDAPLVTRSPDGLKYNLNAIALPNLETFLANGGVIDVVSPMSLTISEIMWGSDASIKADNSKSQWIELRNSGDGANTLDDDAATAADEATRLIFYGYGQAPAATLNADGTMTLPAGVKDRVGTIDAKGAVWSLAGKGQSGRTGAGEEALQLTATYSDATAYLDVSYDGRNRKQSR